MPILCEIYELDKERDVVPEVYGRTIRITRLEIEPKANNILFGVQYSMNGEPWSMPYRCHPHDWVYGSICNLSCDDKGIFVSGILKIKIVCESGNLNGIATVYYELL